MLSFQTILEQYIKPNGIYISVALGFIIFTIVAYYGYQYYYVTKSDSSKYSDVANASRRDKIVSIYFFNADWCPHCKTALPEWTSFVSQYDKKVMNGYEIKCININCTEETADVATAINKYGIESYPTVKMEKDGKVIDFESKITSTALEKFATTMIH
uniref:Thioredoxin domain-containing protein n=1 Tax=viral metagenome TaxID=1070528 RepID=A0A6C0I4A5_9ZZZZ